MKKVTFNYLVSFVIAALFLASCGGLDKMADRAKELANNVTPNPLEMHAEKVSVSIAGTIPPKYFDKKAILVVTPVLKYATGEYKLKTHTLQGEKVQDNNPVISYADGGSFNYSDVIPYTDEMRVSTLELRMEGSRGDEKADLITVDVAKAVNVTPRLIRHALQVDGAKFIEMPISMEAKISDLQEAIILYALQKSDLKTTEAKKDEVKSLLELLNTTTDDAEKKLMNVEISSYASPDGPEDLNQKLVDARGKTAQDYIIKQTKKAPATALKDPNFVVKATTPAEDWDGFKEQVQKSTIADKEVILRVLQMYTDPVVREREIKNISQAYTQLKEDVLPQLRRSVIRANYETKVKSDGELLSMAASGEINKLKFPEVLYSASIATDAAMKTTLYNRAIELEPKCFRAFNNLGVIKGKAGDIAGAKADFEKANELKANDGMILANLGACAFADGDLAKAEKYFADAKAAGCQSPFLGYNMAVINVINGKYAEAITNFGSENTFGKALAQTLNKQNPNAENTLNAMGEKNSGWFYYLKAIVAAKENKDDAVFTNLRTAISKTPETKAYAKGDVEFIKLWENETFKGLVQ
jgi:tetratricopeptide (TPR) repeat protein/outer membrane protein OmpA-like peptidoglycan-associated protein